MAQTELYDEHDHSSIMESTFSRIGCKISSVLCASGGGGLAMATLLTTNANAKITNNNIMNEKYLYEKTATTTTTTATSKTSTMATVMEQTAVLTTKPLMTSTMIIDAAASITSTTNSNMTNDVTDAMAGNSTNSLHNILSMADHCWNTYALISFVAIVCYVNGMHGEFVHDDIPAITLNRDVLGTNKIVQVFKNDFWGMPMADANSHKSYRPLTVLTFR